MKQIFSISLLSLIFTACQTVESISISQIPVTKNRSNAVHSESSSPIIFGIPFGTSYIDEAEQELLSSCAAPSRLEGVLSKHVSTNYFLGLVTSQKVLLSGYCLASVAVESKSPEPQKAPENTKVKTKKKS
jgi:hypothetical protein